ncbi:metallophosphoesterase family protein [Clostridium sp. CTA-7]
MSIYAMSDLHGCYNKFISMINLIDFNETDELYILGDIFDRGLNPLGILDYVLGHKNITLIKGNHEKMLEEYFESGNPILWFYNGGQSTHIQIMEKDYIYQETLYKYIKELPIIKVVDKFILVHAGLHFDKNCDDLELEEFLKQEEDICLWDRSNIGNEKKYRDYIVVCGHTPVQTINNDDDDYDLKIKIVDKTIYIDCGCVFEEANGKLACLRLDDMKEFYV